MDYSIEIIDAKNRVTVLREDLDIDGKFKINLKAYDGYNEFSINLYDGEGNPVEIDGNSPNSINYRKAINPGVNILSSSISLYLDDDSSLILNRDFDESMDIESEKDYVKEYSKRFNSTYLLASKGEALPINRKKILHTTQSIGKGDDAFIKLSFY